MKREEFVEEIKSGYNGEVEVETNKNSYLIYDGNNNTPEKPEIYTCDVVGDFNTIEECTSALYDYIKNSKERIKGIGFSA